MNQIGLICSVNKKLNLEWSFNFTSTHCQTVTVKPFVISTLSPILNIWKLTPAIDSPQGGGKEVIFTTRLHDKVIIVR